MIYDPETAVHLKPWLVRTLEPICDAEPGALADYILALLQHNVPESEMRQELAVQLDEFLEKECGPFIDSLFNVIRSKSYLPYNAAPSSPSSASKPHDAGIPIPLDVLLPQVEERTRKRSNVDDERDGRPPAKGPRLNHDGQFSRYGTGDGRMGGHSSGGWNRPQVDRFGDVSMGAGMGMYPAQAGAMGMNNMGVMNGRRNQGYQPPDQKRGVCRDYYNNGYCARGAMCKYSHGEDAVVPGQLYPGAMPFMPMFAGNPGGMPFMQGAAYDPHEARMDMRPTRHHQRAPLLPRIQQEDGSRVVHPVNASGELPVIQDLTPVVPPDAPPAPSEPIQQGDVNMEQTNTPPAAFPGMAAGYPPMLGPMTGSGNVPQAMGQPMEIDSSMHLPGMRPPTLSRGNFRGGRGGRGRGTFGGDVHNFRPEKRNDKTLVVEKIPEDSLSLESVNNWFKRFGTVTNVAIDATSAKALVSFSNHEEAHAAWKSEEAVFGNRFVKVFWHRPMEGHGQVGARMLAASAPLVANMAKSPSTTPQPTPISASASTSSNVVASSTQAAPKPTNAAGSSSTLSALAAKQQQLEQKIAEQKSLMASLEKASPEEKKDIMARLRKLGEEMTNLTSTSAPASTSTPAGAPGTATKKSSDSMTEHEKREREKLDKELEKHSAGDKQAGDTTEDLKAKLEKLKAEAASLGLDSALPSTSAPYRGYRGRGRGGSRGYFRGASVRGGPPRGSMKLDNRPKKLLVRGVNEDKSQALRDWYETTGQLESVEPADSSESFIVSFKSRSAAEMGLAKGANIPLVGTVQVSWYTGKEGTATSTTTQSSKPLSNSSATIRPSTDDATHQSPESQDAHLQEEEIVANGWGGDGDDEDGMGLL